MRGKSEALPNDNFKQDNVFIKEVLETFAGPDFEDCHWTSAVRLAREIGYSDLSVAAVSKYSGSPLWIRTSMEESWVKRYLEQRYFAVDPFITHLKSSCDAFVLDYAEAFSQTSDSKLRDFYADSLDLGYAVSHSFPSSWPVFSRHRVVTFSTKSSTGAFDASFMANHAGLLAEILVTRITQPDASMTQGVIWPLKAALSDRERELLQYLALGLKNDRIAERCGLAEVTVRKHLLSAREKLGATTREQALAIALQDGLIGF